MKLAVYACMRHAQHPVSLHVETLSSARVHVALVGMQLKLYCILGKFDRLRGRKAKVPLDKSLPKKVAPKETLPCS